MPLQVLVSDLALNAAPGVQSITGVGFQPVAIIFWQTGNLGGFTGGILGGMGAATGPSNQFVTGGFSDVTGLGNNRSRSHIDSGAVITTWEFMGAGASKYAK